MQTLRRLENPPTQKLATSHLTVLIGRVLIQEENFGYVKKDQLLNLAEYIIAWPGKYSKKEHSEAVKILIKYGLGKLACPFEASALVRNRIRKEIEKQLDAKWIARCARCGRAIWSKESLRTGYGGICRRKLGIKTSRNTIKR